MKGRTRSGRLKALDAYVVDYELRRDGPSPATAPILDLGFGDEPITTVELHEATEGRIPIIGIEADEVRALGAAKHERANLRFVRGDWDLLPLLPRARIIRVMNVLRSGPVQHGFEDKLAAALVEGGLAIEGSSDPTGDLLTAHLLRKRNGALEREALLFHTTFARGFAPLQFRDWLPRDLRRNVKPGQPIHALLERWTEAWRRARTADPKESFIESVKLLGGDEALAARGFYRAPGVAPK